MHVREHNLCAGKYAGNWEPTCRMQVPRRRASGECYDEGYRGVCCRERRHIMKFVSKGVLLVLLALGPPLLRAWVAGMAQAPEAVSPATAVRIVEPRSGQKLGNDFVNVRFEAGSPTQTTSDIPTYQLQLDSRAPITTNDNQVTFTGLQPGPHTVSVQAIDANGTPLPGSRNVVQFVFIPAAAPSTGGPHSQSETTKLFASGARGSGWTPQLKSASSASSKPAADETDAAGSSENSGLPDTGSALPLLSIIGFGVLMGGIFSARRTR
jgi:LPXTG-motif cell wall-anchored protein